MATDWSQFQPIAEPVPQAPLPTAGGTDWSQFEPVSDAPRGTWANVQGGSASVPMAQFAGAPAEAQYDAMGNVISGDGGGSGAIGERWQDVKDFGALMNSDEAFAPYADADMDPRRLVSTPEGFGRTFAANLLEMGPMVANALNPGQAAAERITGVPSPSTQASKWIEHNVAVNPETERFISPASEAIATGGGLFAAGLVPVGPAGEAANAARAGHLGPEIQGAQVADDILASAKPAVKPRVRIGEDGRPVSADTLDVPTETPPAIAGAAPEQQAADTAAVLLSPANPLPELSRPIRTAQDAKAADLDARIAADNLTPEQAEVVRRYAEPVRTDTLSGMLANEHSFPAVERGQQYAAETGAPVQYLSLDMRNLGGLNAKLGHTGANPHIKALADIIREELPATHAELVRKGGDEFAAVLYGVGPDEAKAIGQRIEARADEYQRGNGLHETPHTKAGQQGGTGIYAAHSEVLPGMAVDDITGAADTALEARKKAGGFNGDRARKTAGPARTDAGTERPAVGGTDAALPAGVRGGEEAAAARGAAAEPATAPSVGETSNKKAVINAERRARGAAEMDFEGRRTFGDAWDKARAKYEAEGADDLARDYAKNPRPLSTEDNARLAIHRHDLNAERREAVHEAAAAQDAGEVEALERARAKLDNIDDNLEIADRAARQSIGETAHSLGSTRMMTREDYTPGEALVRAKVSKGEALTPKEKARVEKRATAIEKIDAEIDASIRKARPRVSKAAQAEFDSIAERIKTMPRDKLCQV